MRLILVRHGLTDDNVNGILQGQNGKPLNDRGRQQAESLAKRLSVHRVDGIFTSDLERAHQTAAIISRYHRHVVPHIDRRLRERAAGEHGGRPHDDFAQAARDQAAERTHYRSGGGETLVEVAHRASHWHHDLLLSHYGRLLVVVSHGAWLRGYLNWLLDGEVNNRNWDYKHYNTGMTVVDLHGSKPKLIMLNDISHLA